MTHSEKVKMARKMLTREEREKGVPIFQSFAWETRKIDIRFRVEQQQARAHQRAIERKKERGLKRILSN